MHSKLCILVSLLICGVGTAEPAKLDVNVAVVQDLASFAVTNLGDNYSLDRVLEAYNKNLVYFEIKATVTKELRDGTKISEMCTFLLSYQAWMDAKMLEYHSCVAM